MKIKIWTLMLLLSVLLIYYPYSLSEQTKFYIVVIGDGVPSPQKPTKRYIPLNRSQGIAMWDGVKTAFDKSPRLKKLKELIELKPYDDGGNPEDAVNYAKEIQLNPKVLAVIGHAISETTRYAGWIYEQSGIPLVMPIATSPNVVFPPHKKPEEKNRIKNAFRLPPSDLSMQAPAVAYVAREIAKAKKIYLIRDVSKGAKEYSNLLFKWLEKHLSDWLDDSIRKWSRCQDQR